MFKKGQNSATMRKTGLKWPKGGGGVFIMTENA